MNFFSTPRMSEPIAPELAEAVAEFRLFQPPEKPPELVAAEAELADVRRRLDDAKAELKRVCLQFREEQAKSHGFENPATVSKAQAPISALEAERARLKQVVDEIGESWRRGYQRALSAAARPLRVALRETAEKNLAEIEKALAVLDGAAFRASNERVGTNWILRNAAGLAQLFGRARQIIILDADLDRQGF